MDVVVAGSNGLLGTALVGDLVAHGHAVTRLVRPGASVNARSSQAPEAAGTPGTRVVPWDPRRGQLPGDALDGVDVVVNLGGAGLGDHRWTRSYQAELRRSRLAGTELLARAVAAAPQRPVLVQASAMGLYGDAGDRLLDESATPGDGFLADLVADWEAATLPARRAGARVVLLRTSIVLAAHGGALGRLLPLLRLGAGGPLGSGRQYWSWITLPDHVAAVEHLVAADVEGAVNVASPDPVRCRDLVSALGRALRRPAVLPVPRVALRVAVGAFADDLLTSARLDPAVLRASGFRWAHPDIDGAAAWVAASVRARRPRA